LLTVINEVRPQVIVTYDDNGFYGHPDHIQAHRVARRAFELADGLVSKFYATAMPKSVLAAAMALPQEDGTEVGELGGADFSRVESVDDLPFGTDDENVTTEIDAQDYLDAKLAAMRAHASQIAVDSPFFALSDMVGRRALGTEYYTLLAAPGGASPQEPSAGEGASPSPAGRENDLFAGLDG
jgi:N-acetyl-1-D-myo-inositol-2-amino-2-deoxy-alpha-D-glucopyranoside deacetylase